MSRTPSKYQTAKPMRQTLVDTSNPGWRGDFLRQHDRSTPGWNWNDQVLPAPVIDVVGILDAEFYRDAQMRLFLREGEDGAILVLYCPNCFQKGNYVHHHPWIDEDARCHICRRGPTDDQVQSMRCWMLADWQNDAEWMIEMAKETGGWYTAGTNPPRPRPVGKRLVRVHEPVRPLVYGASA